MFKVNCLDLEDVQYTANVGVVLFVCSFVGYLECLLQKMLTEIIPV